MVRGIRYQEGMEPDQLKENGFEIFEYQYEEKTFFLGDTLENGVGIVIKASTIFEENFRYVLNKLSTLGADYLVIETVGLDNEIELTKLIEHHLGDIISLRIYIYIENGYCSNGNGEVGNAFSEISDLMDFTDMMNQKVKDNWFGICLNIGYANLLGRNVSGMIKALGRRIRLIHANDNGGRNCQRQLPYTFTKGRGQLTTDWYSIIGTLAKEHYKGAIVFDVVGLFSISPKALYSAWYPLLFAISREWEMILELEKYLKSTERLIVFGSGNMFKNYMEVWGKMYPPNVVVDNNVELWGKERGGIIIRCPQEILKYSEEKPEVMICNMFYESVENQLKSMQVASRRYDDKYFFNYQSHI